MSTYSIFTASSIESTRYDNIVDILNGLPDNISRLISPRDVRNAVLSAYDNTIFRETTVSTFTGSYLGLDNSTLRLPVLLGKKTLSGAEVLDSGLLSSDGDIFLYNAKSDLNPSLQDTRIVFLAGSVFNDFDYAPYIQATKITSPSRIDLSIINPATAGIINIGTSQSRVYLNGYEYPTFLGSQTGSVLQYDGYTASWNQVISGTVGYIPYYNTSTTLAPSFLKQNSSSVILINTKRFTDETGLLNLDFSNGQGIYLASDSTTHATAFLNVSSSTASLNYGSTKYIHVANSRIKLNHTSYEAILSGGISMTSTTFSISSNTFKVGTNNLSYQCTSTTGSYLDITKTDTTVYSPNTVNLMSNMINLISYDYPSTYFGYQMIIQTYSAEILGPTNGDGLSLLSNGYYRIKSSNELAIDSKTLRTSIVTLETNSGGDFDYDVNMLSLPGFNSAGGVMIGAELYASDPDDDVQAALVIGNGVNNAFYIRFDSPNLIKFGLTPTSHYFFDANQPSGFVTTHKTLDSYGSYATYSNNSYRYLATDATYGNRFKNSSFRRSYTHPTTTGQFFTVSHNFDEKFVSVTAYRTHNNTYSLGVYSSSASITPTMMTASMDVKVIDQNTLWVYLPTSYSYVITVNA